MFARSPLVFVFAISLSNLPGFAQAGPPRPITTPYAQAGPLEIRQVDVLTRAPTVHGKVELEIVLSATYDNPFDSTDILVDAEIRSGKGTARMPGFLYRPFERRLDNGREILQPAREPVWRLRFTPTAPGEHLVTVIVRDRTGTVRSEPVRLEAAPGALRGFIRVSPADPRYFAFENGEAYFPIGANTCWAYGRGTFDYDVWFGQYAKAGCNYGRLWLSPHWTTFALERSGPATEGLGFGQFDLANAWRIDYVLDLAATHQMALMLCIDSYNILRQKDGYPQWDSSPHNAAQGGPLHAPAEFWTNSVMDKVYRDKLRYLVARYAYSTHVLSWEFWNEADITSNYRTAPALDWHRRMGRFLRDLDPYDHLVTTSFASTAGDAPIDALPELDYIQSHHYNSPDLALTIAQTHARKGAILKPHLFGEIGADSGGPRNKDDGLGLQVHDPIWTSLVVGDAGSAQPWWWDNNIHPNNLYPLFAAAVAFAKDIDWPREQFARSTPRFNLAATSPEDSASAQPGLFGWAIAGKKTALLWTRVEGRTWKRLCAQKETVPPAPESVLTLPGLTPGRWSVEFWDTWKGVVTDRVKVEVPASGEARLPLPRIEKDLALKFRIE